MPFPILIGALAALPTLMNIGSKLGKFYLKTGSLGKAATFGIGYGGGTAIGFNLVPQFGRKSLNNQTLVNLDKKMPYGRSYSRYRPRYRRYSTYSRYRRYRPRYRRSY